MSRNDHTVPTRCRHRGGIVDPLGCKACRAIRQPISPSNQILDHSIQNHPIPVSLLSSGVSSESSLTPLNPTVTHTQSTSGVPRLASQICHNRLFRKKSQHNLLPMISTEVSSLAAHNKCQRGVDTEAEWSTFHVTRPVGPSFNRSAIKSIT
jgi:hypothetical protein